MSFICFLLSLSIHLVLCVGTYRTVVLPDSLCPSALPQRDDKGNRAYPAPSSNSLSSLCSRRASSFKALSIIRDFLISSIRACESSWPAVGPAGVDAHPPMAVCSCLLAYRPDDPLQCVSLCAGASRLIQGVAIRRSKASRVTAKSSLLRTLQLDHCLYFAQIDWPMQSHLPLAR